MVSLYSLTVFVLQRLFNILLIDLHNYFIYKNCYFFDFWKCIIDSLSFNLQLRLILLLIIVLLSGLIILLMRLISINNLTILMKIISRYQTMVHDSRWFSAMNCQLQNLICVCVTVRTAKLIWCWLCIPIINNIH